MTAQNTFEIKNKILEAIQRRGPSLPAQLASEVQQSILFTSAFLSELLSEKKVKTSHLRVGSSPVYLIPGQELQLEKFSHHLKSREKDACIILKEKKFLKDNEQEPAIRIALREIKDFAVPFKKNQEIFWRYFTVLESEIKIQEKPKQKETGQKKEQEIPKGKSPKRKPSQKKNEKFFNKVKEFLAEKNIEILGIESFSQNDLFLRVSEDSEEKLLAAYNKKRITEAEIINSHKKATELNLKFILLSLSEPTKKLSNLIEAMQNISKLEKLK